MTADGDEIRRKIRYVASAGSPSEDMLASMAKRRVRVSRLDILDSRSMVHSTGLLGLIRLTHIVTGVWLITSPLCSYYETGHFIDVSLLQDAFKNFWLLMTMWFYAVIYSYTGFGLVKLSQYKQIPRSAMRVLLYADTTILMCSCLTIVRAINWSVFPSVFIMTIAIIFFMKIHSYVTTVLDLQEVLAQKDSTPELVAASKSLGTSAETKISADVQKEKVAEKKPNGAVANDMLKNGGPEGETLLHAVSVDESDEQVAEERPETTSPLLAPTKRAVEGDKHSEMASKFMESEPSTSPGFNLEGHMSIQESPIEVGLNDQWTNELINRHAQNFRGPGANKNKGATTASYHKSGPTQLLTCCSATTTCLDNHSRGVHNVLRLIDSLKWSPEHLDVKDFTKFLLCPTLVYELSYPRDDHAFRWRYFVSKSALLAATLFAIYLTASLYTIPIMTHAHENSFVYTFASSIVPLFIMDLLFFYMMFECIMNLFAEITSFGDRDFYQDWWNSTTWEEFARKWNHPVHQFLLRHIYLKIYHHTAKRRNSSGQAAAAKSMNSSPITSPLISTQEKDNVKENTDKGNNNLTYIVEDERGNKPGAKDGIILGLFKDEDQVYEQRRKVYASVLTFFYSAIIHEFFLTATLGFVSWYITLIMMFQIPLFAVSKFHKNTTFGNIFFGFGICLGIPFIAVLYAKDWSRRLQEAN